MTTFKEIIQARCLGLHLIPSSIRATENDILAEAGMVNSAYQKDLYMYLKQVQDGILNMNHPTFSLKSQIRFSFEGKKITVGIKSEDFHDMNYPVIVNAIARKIKDLVGKLPPKQLIENQFKKDLKKLEKAPSKPHF